MGELNKVEPVVNCDGGGDVINNNSDDTSTAMSICCFVCKHPMHNAVDIFTTRTAYSKTLVSCKLSRLVQTVLRPPGSRDRRGRRIRQQGDVDGDERASLQLCPACVELINQVDECEIKLMALENEVKLKYKMPFPIEVHSRDDEVPAGDEGSGAGDQGSLLAPHPADGTVLVPTGAGAVDDCGQHFNVISMDGTVQAADGSTIVIQTADAARGGAAGDADGLMVYTSGEQQQDGDAAEALHYIKQLEADAVAGDARVIHLTDEDDPLAGMVDVVAQEEDEDGDVDEDALLHEAGGGGGTRRGSSGAIPRIFFCSDCDEAFVSLPHLRRHRLQHGEGKTFPCRFCRRTFATNIALHNHWNAEHADRLKPCPYCSKRFINRSNLNQHMAIHRAPTFKCEFCNRQFRSKGDVRKHHVFRHNTVKDHRCSECDMSFKVNWLLTRHRLRVHGH